MINSNNMTPPEAILARSTRPKRTDTAFDAESKAVMETSALGYLSRTRPTITHLYMEYRLRAAELNEQRRVEGIEPIHIAAMSTFHRKIGSLNKFDVATSRYGFDRAAKQFATVAKPNSPVCPPQLVRASVSGATEKSLTVGTSRQPFEVSCSPQLIETRQDELSLLRASLRPEIAEGLVNYAVAFLKSLGIWRRLSRTEKARVREVARAWAPEVKL
ncbi:hypothetical protein [Rhizobium leguminosarum]|uniref:hypothetical protein n=1 Tax=Rhizobium leguminosarum TaxID=384 RepID=UPI001031C742|nr:hypothetical protein [Rhizobium leguminosarum]TAY13857.1 hypothetical protein ELH96_19795 [Rhizobium leguminosarum]